MYKILGADQNEYGPVSADELRSWIAQGRANAQSLVQAAGGLEWRPLGAFPEFASALAGPSGTPPPAAAGSGSKTNGMAIAGFV